MRRHWPVWLLLQSCEWFSEVPWTELVNGSVAPPWQPRAERAGGHANFLEWGPIATASATGKQDGASSSTYAMPHVPWAPGVSPPAGAATEQQQQPSPHHHQHATASRAPRLPPAPPQPRSIKGMTSGVLATQASLSSSLPSPTSTSMTAGSKAGPTGESSPRRHKDAPTGAGDMAGRPRRSSLAASDKKHQTTPGRSKSSASIATGSSRSPSTQRLQQEHRPVKAG